MKVLNLASSKYRSVLCCVVIYSTIFILVDAQQREGDVCIDNNSERGVCTRKNLCRSLREDFNHDIRPVFCSYKGNVDIICCREKSLGERAVGHEAISAPSANYTELENIFDLHKLRDDPLSQGRKKHSISSSESAVNLNGPKRLGSREDERNYVAYNNPTNYYENDKVQSNEDESLHVKKEVIKGSDSDSLENDKGELRERRVWGQSINYDNNNFALYGTTKKPNPPHQQSLDGYRPHIQYQTTGKYQDYKPNPMLGSWQTELQPAQQPTWAGSMARPTRVPQTQLLTHRPTISPNQYYQETFTQRTTRSPGYHEEHYNARPTRAPKPKPPLVGNGPRPSHNSNGPSETYFNKPTENNNWQYENNYSGPTENNYNRPTASYHNKPTENYNRPTVNYYDKPIRHQSQRPSSGFQPSSSQENYGPQLKPKPTPGTDSIMFPSHEPEYHPQSSESQASSHGHHAPDHNYAPGATARPTRRPNERKRISEIKCKEYSQIVVETIAGLPLTADPQPVEIQVQKCNHNAQQLIVGGHNSTAGEFPHMAAVGFINKRTGEVKWGCGGSLISESFVLTAGHCTDLKYGNPGVVRLGELHLKRNDDGAHPVDYMVEEMIKHPEYHPPMRYNDIALLKLVRPVSLSVNIRPACLYTKPMFSVTKTVATGWGSQQYASEPSPMLLKVVINIIDNEKCNSLYKAESKTPSLSQGIIDSQMCAGDLNGQKDTCQGDSGGPIEITTRSNQCLHHIIGVTSFGKRCGLPNAPGVYTRVSSYISWIESIVWPERRDSKERTRRQ